MCNTKNYSIDLQITNSQLKHKNIITLSSNEIIITQLIPKKIILLNFLEKKNILHKYGEKLAHDIID